jgi:Fic family protein
MNEILKDPNFFNFKKMKYKYGKNEFSKVLHEYQIKSNTFNLLDFFGNKICYTFNGNFNESDTSLILSNNLITEIYSTLKIEDIQTTKETIKNILLDNSYQADYNNEILGIIYALDFISQIDNKINSSNLRYLYEITINNYLKENNKISKNDLYRNSIVYITDGINIIHSGLPFNKLETYMNSLFDFINNNEIDPIIKSIVAHFYLAYLHPYFDGNGRISRLLQIWILIQAGYNKEFYFQFSYQIEKNRKKYYDIFMQIEENYKETSILDITIFIIYFNDLIVESNKCALNLEKWKDTIDYSLYSNKEIEIIHIIELNYFDIEFSSFNLKKEFVNISYETIRGFILKALKNNIIFEKSRKPFPKYMINLNSNNQ